MRTSEAIAAIALLTASASSCSHLFYHPTDVMYVRNPEQLDGLRTEVSFEAADGVKLSAWWLPARKVPHRGVVVQFHGNAQNLTAHFASLLWLLDEGYDLLAFDYRGYGLSEGKPSQAGLYNDALAAIRFALTRADSPSTPIVLYGQSLGGAVLLRAFEGLSAPERARVSAVVIEGSFHSYRAISRDVLSRRWWSWWLQPLTYLLVSDSYSPEDSIERVAPTPILVVHGAEDPVVPLRFGREIYGRAREPKAWVEVPGGGHLNAPFEAARTMQARVIEFLRSPERAR